MTTVGNKQMNIINGNKYKVDYNKEDIIESLKNKILLEWISKNHPSIIASIESFLKEEIENET